MGMPILLTIFFTYNAEIAL